MTFTGTAQKVAWYAVLGFGVVVAATLLTKAANKAKTA